MWQTAPQTGSRVQQRSPPLRDQHHNSGSVCASSAKNGTMGSGSGNVQPSDGRNLLKSLTFHRVLYMSESFTNKKYNAGSNMLRKNYENFVLLKHKQALVTPGPKKAKDFPRGIVIAYPSGHIVSAATRQHFVGLAPQPDLVSKVPPGPPRDNIQTYADWIRRKFRSHETEPPCATNGHTRFLNFLTRADLPQPPAPRETIEVFLEEFHDFLKVHFPHWSVVYDPEVSPVMAVCRLQKDFKPTEAVAAAAAAAEFAAKEEQDISPEETPGSRKSQMPSPSGVSGPPSKLQRGESESIPVSVVSADDAVKPTLDSTSNKPRCGRGRLILPMSQQPKHLWPPSNKIVSYCRKEWALATVLASSPGSPEAASALAELRVTLLIGAAHIVAHCRSSGPVLGEGTMECTEETICCQQATSAAVSDIWSLLRYFIGTSTERFSKP